MFRDFLFAYILEYANVLDMSLKELCRAFGNPVRVQIVVCLSHEATVSELLGKCTLSQSALSQHLAILREARIVKTKERGRYIYYKIADKRYIHLARTLLLITKMAK